MQQKVVSRQIEWVPVSKLLLDNKNPRLPLYARDFDQNELLREMERDFDLVPVAQSMADNGYFVEEPLIVIPKSGDEFIVVEGNRRLAAMKLLTNPELRRRAHYTDTWEKLAKASKYDLTRAPVIIRQSREELIELLGFRHIAGIMKWDPLAKARFISHIIEQDGPKADFKEISRRLGSKTPAIRNNYAAYQLYIQARDEFEIDVSKLEMTFSVFYRALTSINIQKFIGLDKRDKSPRKLKRPVSEKKAEALKELIEFIHGTSDKSPVITDSRQLTKLGEVIVSREALDYLRLSRNLEDAYALTSGEEKSLIKSLKEASFNLDEALKSAHRYSESAEVARLVDRCTGTVVQILQNFPDVKEKLKEKLLKS